MSTPPDDHQTPDSDPDDGTPRLVGLLGKLAARDLSDDEADELALLLLAQIVAQTRETARLTAAIRAELSELVAARAL